MFVMTSKELWELYHIDIKRFIFSKVKNEQLANDLTQETFLKAHINLNKLKDLTKAKQWLFAISRNLIYDYFRKNTVSIAIDENMISEALSQETVHTAQDCLLGIIKNLPKKYRDPLFLSDVKGMKQAAVAAQLGLALPTVKSQIQRARKLITQGYMECCDYKLNDDGFLIGEVQEKENCKVCN